MSADYIDFISHIKRKLGIDLTLYKEAQMKRRLTSLRNKRGFSTFNDYAQVLDKDEVLLQEFVDRLTINVSEFYRNPKRWHVLQDKILPALLNKSTNLTVWSAACSTGEEPYSIAIMLREHFPHVNLRIIATDIDGKVLEKAKRGIYQKQALKELPFELKEKYFRCEHGLYYIDNRIKQMVTFKKHNLLVDRYPRNVDLIVCRNVLIYFTDQAKEIIYERFSDALVEKGVLFVGSTEQIFSPNQYHFSLLDTFFYTKE
ncbi:CheR family methyltransferase [Virgibacillus ndiopensis]|uniref:CheR family methyltransferase n=1 Tax=Virgibacillus ndiopensis TaxID=2004408 RepID=UPI000C07003B|nr:protein-glutamate O-methyltransferase CheR [Virgibacillus ndiopensis]